MRERFLFLIIALGFILWGCTTPMPASDQGSSSGAEAGTGSGAATEGKARSTAAEVRSEAKASPTAHAMVAEYMERQEKELVQRFASAEHPTVRRSRYNILITFKSDLMFDLDSFTLRDEASKEIDQLAEVLKRYPRTRVRVNGFTDSIGSERENLELSENHAVAVKNALVRSGINPDRIRARGYGEDKPIRSNATDSGRQLNRRVVIVIVPTRS